MKTFQEALNQALIDAEPVRLLLGEKHWFESVFNAQPYTQVHAVNPVDQSKLLYVEYTQTLFFISEEHQTMTSIVGISKESIERQLKNAS